MDIVYCYSEIHEHFFVLEQALFLNDASYL